MAVGDFDNFYSSSPWGNVTSNQRTYYEAQLQAQYYLKRFIYGRFIGTQFNLGEKNAKLMVLNNLIDPHANNDPIGSRSLWMVSSRLDSMSRTITFEDYGGKLSLHKYDELVTYWKDDREGGLSRIVQSALGRMQTEVLEKLARNAFLGHARKFIGDGTLSGFDQVTNSHVLSTSIIRAIHLGMAERDVAYANNPMGQENAIFCVTTPGVIDGIKNAAPAGEWLDVYKYANPMAIVNNEQGAWRGVRFVASNLACLYNCGTKSAQTTVTAAITQGAGADDTTSGGYLGVYAVGQQSGVNKYITVASASGFAVGDKVTIHKNLVNTYGVTNGVDFMEGSAEVRVIRKISGNQISFDKPIMEDFATDLGGGVYARMTKARHIHTATFIGGPNGVALGVGVPPELHSPAVVDDREAMYRFTWDATMKYVPFTPEVYEVWIGAGANRTDFGPMTI